MSTVTALQSVAATAALAATEATSAANIEALAQANNNVVQAILPAGSLIAQLYSVNMNITTDQLIPLIVPLPADGFLVRHIVVTNASTSMTTAAGGVYPAASKGGTAIVAAAQVYTALTTATKVLDLTVAAQTAQQTAFYFSLTTGQGSASTADIFVYGDPLGA